MLRFRIGFATLLLAASHGALAAQSDWVSRSREATVSLEIYRPTFTNELNVFTSLSVAGFLSSRLPVGETFQLVAELPFAMADLEDPPPGWGSSFMVGSPYVGLIYLPAGSRWSFEGGARAPVAEESEYAGLIGAHGDFDRIEAWLDATTLLAEARYQRTNPRGIAYRFRAGPLAVLAHEGEADPATGAAPDGETEWMFLYAGEIGYRSERGYIGAGLMGRWWATPGDEADFGDSVWHQLVFRGELSSKRVRPTAQLQVPISSTLQNAYVFVFGLGLEVRVR